MTIGKLISCRNAHHAKGLSLIELMIAIAMGMLIVAALLALYLNVTRTNNEMAKMNRQIENGRFAMQLLQDDIVHAGYWGHYSPQFDNLTEVNAPLDAPTGLPDPCSPYDAANWTGQYMSNLIGIAVQGNPGSCGLPSRQADTDVLVVRHAQTCVAGVGGCEAESAGKIYFQSTLCEEEVSATAQGGTSNSITLDADASDTDDFYKDAIIRIIGGTGAGQSRKITGYNGTTKTATVGTPLSPTPWSPIPDNSSVYAFGLGYALGTSGHIFHNQDCTTEADKRKYVSNIYYIRDYASNPGDGIPTLMRSSFDGLAHQAAQPLIEGIQGFRVQYGIDSKSDSGGDVDYTNAIVWADPLNKISPTNRGDGIPEVGYVDSAGVVCASAANCPAANVVAVRIHVLARNLEPTPGYTDSKTYQLGDQTLGPFNDNFKRHVFSTTVRLVNPAGRRETP